MLIFVTIKGLRKIVLLYRFYFKLCSVLQILAVYDRFGRLIHGHPHVAKDVMEYVTFEKHIVSIYGKWRLHQKLIPEWLAKTREPGTITHILEKDYFDEVEEEVPRNTEDDDTEEDVIHDKYGKPIREKK